MNIAIDITNVDLNKLVDGSRFITEFMPMLEELGADYDIVYKGTKDRLKYKPIYDVSDQYDDKGADSISIVFSSKPNNITVFIDILDKLSEYFSNDLLDNVIVESLNK